MRKADKWFGRIFKCGILGLGLLSLPVTAGSWDFGQAEQLQTQRIRQQETINREFQKLLVKAKAQQDQMKKWHKTAAARSVATTTKTNIKRKDATPTLKASTVAWR